MVTARHYCDAWSHYPSGYLWAIMHGYSVSRLDASPCLAQTCLLGHPDGADDGVMLDDQRRTEAVFLLAAVVNGDVTADDARRRIDALFAEQRTPVLVNEGRAD